MDASTEPVRLSPGQLREAGEVLGRAFHDDPATVFTIPDEAVRARVLPHFMGVAVQLGHQYGEVYTTPDSVLGAATWLPPQDSPVGAVREAGRWMLAAALFAEPRLLLAPLRVGLDGVRRFMAATNLMEELHRRDAPWRHWYLAVLGVEPERQGQGIGSSLIQPGLASADREGLPCYLETTKEINVTFYRRHGFEVVVEDDLPGGGPRFWTMKRASR